MASPVIPKAIGMKVAEASVGEFYIIRNLTKGGQLTKKIIASDLGVTFNPATGLTWAEGDLIQAEIRGRLAGVAQKKIKSGTAQFTSKDISASADTSTPGVSL